MSFSIDGVGSTFFSSDCMLSGSLEFSTLFTKIKLEWYLINEVYNCKVELIFVTKLYQTLKI